MKTIKFYTLGCKVNQYDTQSIREKFLSSGYRESERNSKADTYLINTCTVTHRADSESFNLIRRAKKENPRARIIVTGCLTELDSASIKKIGVSSIIKNRDKEKISSINGISDFKAHARAFLKIQDGCDNHCSYCKVPLVRGRSRSRPLSEIIQEARRLVDKGFKEIVLTGICLGLYGKDLEPKSSLVKAIDALEKLDGLYRIRLSSIEAGDVSNALIKKMKVSKKLCRHLHIPIQSGDDSILKKMRRKYTSRGYLSLIRRIRKQIPGVAITTDVLVGFPQEEEFNFRNTLDLVKKISPLKVHIFPYSKREGTAVVRNLKNEVAPEAVKERMVLLKSLADRCSLRYKNEFLGRKLDVLIEGRSKGDMHFYEGYTDNYIKVLIRSNRDLKNQIISVRLKKIQDSSIFAISC